MTPLPLLLTNISLCILAGVSGISFNSWIVSVNIKDWRRGVRMSPCDQLLSFMGLVNILMQTVWSVDMFLGQVTCKETFARIDLWFYFFLFFIVPYNMWLTAWLSTYFCLRIVSFTKGIFLVMKMRISGFLPKLLVASAVYCFFLAIQLPWNIHAETTQAVIGNATSNSTSEYVTVTVRFPYIITVGVGTILPLLLTLIPIGLTLVSLWRHTYRMKMNTSDSCRPQTQAHVTAARTMILLVTLHTTFQACAISYLMRIFNIIGIPLFFCWYFLLFYCTLQSIVIITGNTKQWKASKGILSRSGLTCQGVPATQDG
ncbi:taste receptor type 2 member 13-like [Pseudophryne corroboree]|uniref:taste receptor type 2 member 13-like n=1 Tax=Pseudophryne corroboree TaxID=495146 RepID=UPI00308185F0